MKVQKKLGAIHASAAAAALSAVPLLRRLRCRHLLRCGGSRVASIRSILNNAPAPYFPLCKKDPGIKPQGRFCLLLRLRAAHPSSELFLRQRFSQSATRFWACLNCSATILPAQTSRCNVVDLPSVCSFANRKAYLVSAYRTPAFHRPCKLQYSYTATGSSPGTTAKSALGSSPG